MDTRGPERAASARGAILTARNRVQMATEGEALAQRIPTGRLGRPDDLAGAALLLCSDAGAYINGVNLHVDGGRAIAWPERSDSYVESPPSSRPIH